MLSRITVLVLALIIVSFSNVYSQYYRLVWSDEFDGTELSDSNWTRETGGNGWGNSELQYYTNRDENAYVSNGKLTIKAIKEDYSNNNYTSARLITKGKKSFQYGKIEAKIRLPYGQGIWPAFWTLGEDISEVSWPKCGEIDIMEMIGGDGRENTVHGTIHWDFNGHVQYGGDYTLSSGTFSDAFHVFSIVWEPDKIDWYVDDYLYNTVNITESHMTEFHKEHFILLNLAVGGNWPGYPNSTTEFPQIMEVDYVRVYQLSNLYPQISITKPINDANFNAGETIEITADVDFEDEIEKVEFFQGSAIIGQTVVKPYSMNWKDVQAGIYKIKTRTISKTGITAESDEVTITIGTGAEQYSYLGYYHKIPGVIEAEDYDLGTSTFSDSDTENKGDAYRNDAVDIEGCEDAGGGFNIGYTSANEWLSYSVNVKKTGTYKITSRVASETGGGKFRIEIDGTDVTGELPVTSTGGWQKWANRVSREVELTEGNHILKIYIINGNFNLNRISIYEPDSQAAVKMISPNGGEVWKAGNVEEIIWESQLIDDVRLRYSVNGGSTWQTIVSSTPAKFGVYRWIVPEDISNNCILAVQNSAMLSTYDLSDNPFEITNVTGADDEETLPDKFLLRQNYPNPFNPSTTIEFDIPYSSQKNSELVKINVFDILGRNVKTLVNNELSAGSHKVTFDATDLNSGVYFYTMNAGDFTQTRKMLLVK